MKRGRIRKMHAMARLAAAAGNTPAREEEGGEGEAEGEKKNKRRKRTVVREQQEGKGEEQVEVDKCIEEAFGRDDPVDWISTFIQPGSGQSATVTVAASQAHQQQQARDDVFMP